MIMLLGMIFLSCKMFSHQRWCFKNNFRNVKWEFLINENWQTTNKQSV